jgi:hypothetical protein
MTEADWLASGNPGPMLVFLRHRARSWTQRLLAWLGAGGRRRDRKPRLFACACCRRIEALLVEPRLREAVRVAELRADALAGPEELSGARTRAAESPWGGAARAATGAAWEDAWEAAAAASVAAVEAVEWHAATADYEAVANKERAAQADLLRDLFGNPFRRVAEVRCAGAHREQTLLLARTIYAERTFERLPQLAERLPAVGCTNREVIEHLCGPGPHARGCWALDLVLGKE